MSKPTMMLALTLGTGYGFQALSWRSPSVDPANYTNFEAQARDARAAERGKFAFLPDTPAMTPTTDREAPQATLEPIVTIAAIAGQTQRIGFVATDSTSFGEPYNTARSSRPWTSSPTAAAAGTR
ncbi:LLM class oxidoreductase [Kineococcus sp. SYSU DK003]|uniref:hypothetical protein n=1 Tax=Kineococcus sp. SYSU DK003 TaxID=3383124 RepID=UPI003D7E28BD